jgi:hypothetical protein
MCVNMYRFPNTWANTAVIFKQGSMQTKSLKQHMCFFWVDPDLVFVFWLENCWSKQRHTPLTSLSLPPTIRFWEKVFSILWSCSNHHSIHRTPLHIPRASTDLRNSWMDEQTKKQHLTNHAKTLIKSREIASHRPQRNWRDESNDHAPGCIVKCWSMNDQASNVWSGPEHSGGIKLT